MNRYQLYLNPQSVNVLDQLADQLDITRSQIIRDVIDRMAIEYRKVLTSTAKAQLKRNPLLKMAGLTKSPTGKVARNIDDIYLTD